MVTECKFLAPPGSTRDVYLGRACYSFKGGRSYQIPDALALRLKGQKNSKGEIQFELRGLPEVVESNKDPNKVGGQLTCFN